MFYKLSNISNKLILEKELGLSFKHPNIYKPNPIINGLNESLLPIITSENSNIISHGIWGILPENFEGDWQNFQNVINTLNVSKEKLSTNQLYKDAFENRRCLIIVSGFFTNYYKDGKIYPYYIYEKSERPFYLAGIYNKLSDGFITCSLLLTSEDGFLSKFQNLTNLMPIIINKNDQDQWLSTDTEKTKLATLLNNKYSISLKAHPIARDFYEQDIVFRTILDPVNYEGISYPE